MKKIITPNVHTKNVITHLSAINAPLKKSHELYWNYREEESIKEYLEKAMEPLIEEGRVPVLITSLDPATDITIIKDIIATKPPLANNHTILIRLSLNSDASLLPIKEVLQDILATALTQKKMPTWWPLLQGDISITSWRKLAKMLGDDWKYVNLAINPFTDKQVFIEFADNIVVTQFFIGAAKDIHENGIVEVTRKCDLGIIPGNKKYDINEYVELVKKKFLKTTAIICGPSFPEWTADYNERRLAKFLHLLEKADFLDIHCAES